MAPIITAPERASFRRCRRQWDLSAGLRQNLEPRPGGAVPDLDRAVRDALAQARRDGRALLDRYLAWAPSVDRFAPVLAEADFEVPVPDPGRPESGLVTAEGAAVRYGGRIDLLAVDEHDAYWIVRHRLVRGGDWAPAAELAADEDALATCWAWEQFYLGLTITGTIWNELRIAPGDTDGPRRCRWRRPRRTGTPNAPPLVRQHEPSGGGRSVPQHRRLYARAGEPVRAAPVGQVTGPGFRRTWVRRRAGEVAAAGHRLAVDVAAMLAPDVATDPSPSDRNCPPCEFAAPCRAMMAGQDPAALLAAHYQRRPAPAAQPGRLGGHAWGQGRGAAPPGFRSRDGG